jgi:hypothetical protein
MHVDLEQRLLLLAVGRALLAQPDDLAQHLDVEAERLGLGELVADVLGERLLVLLQALDLLDDWRSCFCAEACSVVIDFLPPLLLPAMRPNPSGRARHIVLA